MITLTTSEAAVTAATHTIVGCALGDLERDVAGRAARLL